MEVSKVAKLWESLQTLGARKAGIMLLVGAIVVGWTARALAEEFLGGIGGFGPRITALEEWRIVHEDSTTVRTLERLVTLEQDQSLRGETLDNVERMVYQLYCDRWPERCESTPIRDGGY